MEDVKKEEKILKDTEENHDIKIYDDKIYGVSFEAPNNENPDYNHPVLVEPISAIYNKGDVSKIGFNLKNIINSYTVLDITLNPDFGQIEQDPSIINNTSYEFRFVE